MVKEEDVRCACANRPCLQPLQVLPLAGHLRTSSTFKFLRLIYVAFVYERLGAFPLGQDLQNRASFWVTRASPGDSFQCSQVSIYHKKEITSNFLIDHIPSCMLFLVIGVTVIIISEDISNIDDFSNICLGCSTETVTESGRLG